VGYVPRREEVMSAVIIGPELRKTLNGLNEELELQDETGRVLGHFVPSETYRRMLNALAQSTGQLSPEELEKLRREPGLHSWAEVKERLGVQ
jgi:hypothetical protein